MFYINSDNLLTAESAREDALQTNVETDIISSTVDADIGCIS